MADVEVDVTTPAAEFYYYANQPGGSTFKSTAMGEPTG